MNYSFEIDINDFANSWYLHVNDAKCDYQIELGRRPIKENPKINTDYIYISTSNNIESPNDHILFNKEQKMVYFRNVKTGVQIEKPISANISFIRNMGKIYNIYDIYKAIYQNENIEEIYNQILLLVIHHQEVFLQNLNNFETLEVAIRKCLIHFYFIENMTYT